MSAGIRIRQVFVGRDELLCAGPFVIGYVLWFVVVAADGLEEGGDGGDGGAD